VGRGADRHAEHAHRNRDPAAIGLAFSAAVILYALGGRDEQAGRLFGSALGGSIALVVVKLLDLVLP
jgi:hypothetical protein